jgi:predicted nucleotide-binding protein (sugar kinase/HSP70/actin superfamily)
MRVKMFIPIILSILVGYLFGNIIFKKYNHNIIDVFNETTKVYFLQQGVYSSVDSMQKNTKSLKNYIYTKDNNYYRVYVAITKDVENANKLKEIFTNLGNDIYVKEMSVSNNNFVNILEQYDKLINATDDSNSIIDIVKEILVKYKELVVGNEQVIN